MRLYLRLKGIDFYALIAGAVQSLSILPLLREADKIEIDERICQRYGNKIKCGSPKRIGCQPRRANNVCRKQPTYRENKKLRRAERVFVEVFRI